MKNGLGIVIILALLFIFMTKKGNASTLLKEEEEDEGKDTDEAKDSKTEATADAIVAAAQQNGIINPTQLYLAAMSAGLPPSAAAIASLKLSNLTVGTTLAPANVSVADVFATVYQTVTTPGTALLAAVQSQYVLANMFSKR